MRYIYMAGKTSLGGNPYGVLREPLKKELIEMLLKKKKPAVIIENKQETDLDLCEQDEMRPSLLPEPNLGYLINVLKKTGISLEQVGENNGLSFLANIICQFKLLNPGSCNYVCF